MLYECPVLTIVLCFYLKAACNNTKRREFPWIEKVQHMLLILPLPILSAFIVSSY